MPKILCLCILYCTLSIQVAAATMDDTKSDRFPPAPDFPEGLAWLNVDRPLTLAQLRGKIVILDFWTYGCINCLHVMQELDRLKQQFGHSLVVIGVHTPKFDNEQNPASLQHILVRYGRQDPVVNDPGYRLMRMYKAPAWPTLVIIDPAGRYLGRVVGEGHEARVAAAIKELLRIYKDDIDDTPLALAPTTNAEEDRLLAAPTKIAVMKNRVAISDTVLHRIVIADANGAVQQIVGGRQPGFEDGNFANARFNAPRGLTFGADGLLYVADTGNHAIRRLDFKQHSVTTIAGTGRKGQRLRQTDNPLQLGLRSPWALVHSEGKLIVAMAGDHRIWRLDLSSNEWRPLAGSGREGIDDGAAAQASFSQPSGLSLIGDQLFVADPESSAIRIINLKTASVDTLIGTGLFDFGDRDGGFEQAQLQHPLGIAERNEGELLIADTYNHKLKLMDLSKGRIHTLLGTGTPGIEQGKEAIQLNEPGGLALMDHLVLLADTNNRRIIVFDLDRQIAREWPLTPASGALEKDH